MPGNIRTYEAGDVEQMVAIWNEVVKDGLAFPQTEFLSQENADVFFEGQTLACVAEGFLSNSSGVEGLYILHPNNVGRASLIANASFAVDKSKRGCGIGEALVLHCLKQARALGFRIMQFNAVVSSNTHALRLYKRLGFTDLGIIPECFLTKAGKYEDIHVMYFNLLKA